MDHRGRQATTQFTAHGTKSTFGTTQATRLSLGSSIAVEKTSRTVYKKLSWVKSEFNARSTRRLAIYRGLKAVKPGHNPQPSSSG